MILTIEGVDIQLLLTGVVGRLWTWAVVTFR